MRRPGQAGEKVAHDLVLDRLAPRTPLVPAHWWFLLSSAAVAAFAVLTVTGVVLALFYRPGVEPVTYRGAAELYDGRELPEAFASVVRISADVPGGLLLRRVHRAAAGLFVALVIAHGLRVLLTGAFRHPRVLNYLLGGALFVVALVAGLTGQNLPYELLAGTSLRVGYSVLLSIPYAGDTLARWVFGAGEFPSTDVIFRLWVVHTFVVPLLLVGGIALHVWLVARQGHTTLTADALAEPPAADVRVHTVLGLLVAGLLVVAGVLVPWADVELMGPFRVAQATNTSQPDWYLFPPEGAMRILPAIRVGLLGAVITNVFVGAVVLPAALLLLLAAYPLVDRRLRQPPTEPDVLQGPLAVPGRAAVIAGVATAVLVMALGAADDVLARLTRTPIEQIVVLLRWALLLAPLAVGAAVYAYARVFGPGDWEMTRTSDGKET